MKITKANTHYSVAERTQELTVNDIREAASALGLSIPSKARKAEMSDIFARDMPKYVVPCLRRLAWFELELLDVLQKAGSGHGVVLNGTLWYYLLPHCEIVQSQENDDGRELVTLSDELRPIIAKSLPAIQNDPTRKRLDELMQYGYGLVNLYGILDFSDCMDMITFESGLVDITKEEDHDLVCQLLQSGFIMRSSVSVQDRDHSRQVLLSPFVYEPEPILESIRARKDIKHYKAFSRAEIMAAGEMPCIVLPGKHYITFVLSIKRMLGMDDREAYETAQTIWGILQYEVNPMRALQAVVGEHLSFEKMKNLTDALIAFHNDSPRWMLKGHSPSEIFAQHDLN